VARFVAISHPLSHVVRLRRIVAIAVFVVGALSAAEANASCGDWLAGPDDGAPMAAGESHLPLPGAPCHGPNCRNNRQDLPAVPPAPSRQMERPERWFWLSEALAPQPLLCSTLPATAEPKAIDGFRPEIDRPPRV
jgi:hypothetical protein